MGKILGVHHVAISISDVERSIAFYRHFGFEVESRFEDFGPEIETGTGVKNAHIEGTMLERSDMRLELLHYAHRGVEHAPLNNDVGSAHVCFTVDSIADFYDELGRVGVEFVSSPQYHASGINWVYLKDPDGITVELLEEINRSA